ncbi:uncharacterized protein LOC127357039 [Dicentrarchus labrax]|uniref:uncharacterized protein LOC127357039 n=1 Tax=Dicentrarchus labrax TaxID=13489 RepID=UPI0021F52071|nr:uncharacterized protein LOC127357039 [Dicentrarchus labrax]
MAQRSTDPGGASGEPDSSTEQHCSFLCGVCLSCLRYCCWCCCPDDPTYTHGPNTSTSVDEWRVTPDETRAKQEATRTSEDLLNTLEELAADEFRDFKWYLRRPDILEGYQPIKRSKLEGAERRDTVDLMVNTYTPHGALKVTMKILKKIPRNDLVQSLSDTCSGPEVRFLVDYPAVEELEESATKTEVTCDSVNEPGDQHSEKNDHNPTAGGESEVPSIKFVPSTKKEKDPLEMDMSGKEDK